MLRQVHFRAVLAATLLVLLLAPMALALAAPAAHRHSCCKGPEGETATQAPEQCCFISGNPGPAPVAMAPARTASHDRVFVVLNAVTVSKNTTSEYVEISELAPSPPLGPNCSSILRI